jgi:hypothetical protein
VYEGCSREEELEDRLCQVQGELERSRKDATHWRGVAGRINEEARDLEEEMLALYRFLDPYGLRGEGPATERGA